MDELLRFLNAYVTCLQEVDTAQDAYVSLPAWQGESIDAWDAVRPYLNDALGLDGDTAFTEHIATTSVGRLDGWVLVAANPGWNAVSNAAEDEFRRVSGLHNSVFTQQFFGCYPDVTHRTNSTWSRLLKLRANALEVPAAALLTGRRLWATAAQENWAVGGIDLIPFHSARDGITPLLIEPVDALTEAMQTVATETLKMMLRIRPAQLIVSSAAGFAMLERLENARELEDHQVEVLTAVETGLWFDARRYTFAGRQGTVLALSRQVFSGNSRIPKGRQLQEVAALLANPAGG